MIFLSIITLFQEFSSGQNNVVDNNAGSHNQAITDTIFSDHTFKVTMIELGSVRCIPCREMQPVIKSIEEKYGREVSIVFHDVLTEEGQIYGVKFGIKAIPTQVFLDSKGKEFYRHVGFFPEGELVSVLKKQGVKQR